MSPTDTTPEEAEEVNIDPSDVIKQILANDKIPDEARAQIEQAHKAYCNAISTNRDVAECAFGFGLLIGAHVTGNDEKVLKHTDELLKRLHQSEKGTKSGEVRGAVTRDLVKEAALDIIRRGKRRIRSRADLGREVADQLGKYAPTLKTIDRHLAALENAAELPKPVGRKREIS